MDLYSVPTNIIFRPRAIPILANVRSGRVASSAHVIPSTHGDFWEQVVAIANTCMRTLGLLHIQMLPLRTSCCRLRPQAKTLKPVSTLYWRCVTMIIVSSVTDARYCVLTFFCFLKQPCAQILVYNTLAVLVNCLPFCGSFISGSFLPNDSDCNLNPCLQCESVTSLSTFSRFAGRRRGFSAILTGTVRSCSEFARIEHEPCSSKFKRSDYSV
jgi:hypothetical protein